MVHPVVCLNSETTKTRMLSGLCLPEFPGAWRKFTGGCQVWWGLGEATDEGLHVPVPKPEAGKRLLLGSSMSTCDTRHTRPSVCTSPGSILL